MNLTELLIIIVALIIVAIITYIIGKKTGKILADHEYQKQIPIIRKDAAKRSRAVIGGQFSEQLAPYLPNFNYNPIEARFIGKPIDFIVFKGLDNKRIEEVIFVEVKSGNSKINEVEKSLKEAIENKKVKFEEYRIPKSITN